jgi:hypothetical protein
VTSEVPLVIRLAVRLKRSTRHPPRPVRRKPTGGESLGATLVEHTQPNQRSHGEPPMMKVMRVAVAIGVFLVPALGLAQTQATSRRLRAVARRPGLGPNRRLRPREPWGHHVPRMSRDHGAERAIRAAQDQPRRRNRKCIAPTCEPTESDSSSSRAGTGSLSKQTRPPWTRTRASGSNSNMWSELSRGDRAHRPRTRDRCIESRDLDLVNSNG